MSSRRIRMEDTYLFIELFFIWFVLYVFWVFYVDYTLIHRVSLSLIISRNT